MTVGLLLAGLVVLVGAVIQGSVGFGLNLVAAPILALLDPTLVPVPLLLVVCAQATMMVARERRDAQWGSVGWALAGRIPGNVAGVLAIAAIPVAGFDIVVAVAVVGCVALSLVTWTPAPTPRGLVLAGSASGAFATVSAIGGPPMALLYQNSKGPVVRATLSAFFLLSSLSSVVTLAIAGEVHPADLLAAAVLVPFMFLGFALSGPARRLTEGNRIRYAVLTVSTVSAVVLLARTLAG